MGWVSQAPGRWVWGAGAMGRSSTWQVDWQPQNVQRESVKPGVSRRLAGAGPGGARSPCSRCLGSADVLRYQAHGDVWMAGGLRSESCRSRRVFYWCRADDAVRDEVAPRLLAFWRFFRDAIAGPARAPLSVRDLLAWANFVNAAVPTLGEG